MILHGRRYGILSVGILLYHLTSGASKVFNGDICRFYSCGTYSQMVSA
jgi:hypothetical protein